MQNGIDSETDMRELPCHLNPVELKERAKQLAEVDQQIFSKKEARKAVTKKLNDEIKNLEEQQRNLAESIDTEKEPRMVTCKWIEDYGQNCKNLVRQDTGETVDTVAMTAEDRQLGLGSAEDQQPAA